MLLHRIALTVAAVGAANFAAAQELDVAKSGDAQWSLGLGAALIKKPYKDFDDKPLAFPLVTYEDDWLRVYGPGADLKIVSTEPMSIALRARYGFEGYKADDSPYLAGMEKRKNSVWAGFAVDWRSQVINVSVEALGDALRNSKGSRARIQLDHRFTLDAIGITPRLSAEWVDRKYVNYYYGVQPSEVRSGRALYEADSTVNAGIGVRFDYSPAKHHTLFLDASYTRLGNSIKNSPLVARDNQGAVSLGYVYRF